MRLRGIGYALVSSLMFGLGAVLAKLLADQFDTTIIAILALGGGGLLLAGCLIATRRPVAPTLAALTRREWWLLFLVACPGTALPLLVIVAGFARTSALEGGLLLQLIGLAALLFALVLLGERLRLRQSFGVLLLLLGGVLIVVAGAGGSAGAGSALGDLLILAGALGIGFGFVPAKRLSARIEPATLSALRLLVGAATILPIVAVRLTVGGPASLWHPTPTGLWVLPIYIVTNFCLGYLTQQAGFRLLKAWEMAALSQTVPIFSTLFAVLLLHDALTPLQGLGGLLVLLGGLVVALNQQPYKPLPKI